LHCFVLDTSGSMLRDGRLARAKGVLMALMQAAVRRHERVALLCFGGAQVELRVPPSRPGAWRDAWVLPIAGGGGTPVSMALQQASQLMARHATQRPGDTRWLWLLTDGRSRERPACPSRAQHVRLIDFDEGPGALNRAGEWAAAWSTQDRGTDVVHLPVAAVFA
jgi:magnesium chelatase subunit ChlD-like protein